MPAARDYERLHQAIHEVCHPFQLVANWIADGLNLRFREEATADMATTMAHSLIYHCTR